MGGLRDELSVTESKADRKVHLPGMKSAPNSARYPADVTPDDGKRSSSSSTTSCLVVVSDVLSRRRRAISSSPTSGSPRATRPTRRGQQEVDRNVIRDVPSTLDERGDAEGDGGVERIE